MTENEKIQSHILQKYQVSKKLGSGAYGHVWKVKSKQNGLSYAMKKIFQAFQHSTDSQRTFREISILKKISHKNIIRLHQVINSKNGRDIYLVFEFMETDLCNAIYQGILQKVHEKYVIYQMLLSLAYLHSAQIIHRDLKPSNILLKGDCTAKLCDFGLVRFIGRENLYGNVLTEGVATRWYRAPQVLLGSNSYDQRADLWSLGCIIAEMVIKNPLFPGNSTIQQLQKILQFTGKPSATDVESIKCELAEPMMANIQIRSKSKKEYFSSSVDPECISLICSLVQFNPGKRMTAVQALSHPYLKQFYDPNDIKLFQGKMLLQINDNIQLSTAQYKSIITKYFVQSKEISSRKLSAQKLGMICNNTPLKNKKPELETSEPQKFSDLKKNIQQRQRESLGKQELPKASSKGKYYTNFRNVQMNCKQKTDLNLFQQLIKRKSSSKGKNTQFKDGASSQHSNHVSSYSKLPSNEANNFKQIVKQNYEKKEVALNGGIVFRKSSKSKDKENVSSNVKEYSYISSVSKGNLLQKYQKKSKQPCLKYQNQIPYHSGSNTQLNMQSQMHQNYHHKPVSHNFNQYMNNASTNSQCQQGATTSFSGLRKVSKLNR